MTPQERLKEVLGQLAEICEHLKGEEHTELRQAVEEAFEILDSVL